jgi:hypothetical protein
MVGVVIHALLTNEDLRVRYITDPVGALADLNLRGLELTKDEIDLFVQADARLWFWNTEFPDLRVH